MRLHAALLEAFAVPDPSLFYISFADDDAFLGGCFVEGLDEKTAFFEACLAGINPGGAALIIGPMPRSAVKESHIGRLITDKDEIEDAAND
jgi:hypothetical protein